MKSILIQILVVLSVSWPVVGFSINIQQFSRSNTLTYEMIEDARSRNGHVINDYKWLGTLGYSIVEDPLVVKNSSNSVQRSSVIHDLQTVHFGFGYFVSPTLQLGFTTGYSKFETGDGDDHSGLMDLDLRAKFRIHQNENIAFSLMPTLTIPLDKKRIDIVDSNGTQFGRNTVLSDNSVGYGLRLLGEYTLNSVQLVANLGYRYSDKAVFTDNSGFEHINMKHQVYTGIGAYIPLAKTVGINVEFVKLFGIPVEDNINPNEFFVGTSFGIYKYIHGFAGLGIGNLIGDSNTDGNDLRYSAGIKFYFEKFTRAELKRPVVIGKQDLDCPYQLFPTGNVGTIRFKNDHYTLSETEGDSVNAVAKAIAKNKEQIEAIKIIGHTSKPASNTYNWDLSQKRTMKVRAMFIKQGVPSNRIGVAWRGESEVVGVGQNHDAAKQNRRVEFQVFFKGCK